MAIKLKAIERNVSFDKNTEKWAYVLQPELYNRLSTAKVIQEAARRSGISKGAINAAWDAIGEVIKAWATEGHSVAVPGLGTMRFGIRATSVEKVDDVASSLITSRRVIFTPNVDIKNELKSTSISISCYDRDGNLVKSVTSTDDSDVEDNETTNNDTTTGTTQTVKYKLTLASADASMGSVTPAGENEYDAGTQVNISAVAASGYTFLRWSDGDTNATRTLTMDEAKTLTATFQAQTPSGGNSNDDEGAGD